MLMKLTNVLNFLRNCGHLLASFAFAVTREIIKNVKIEKSIVKLEQQITGRQAGMVKYVDIFITSKYIIP
jgi:hypothetical protein